MTCEKWIKLYVKQNQPVPPADVYAAGKNEGFTRAEIKKARKWYGKYIDTEINNGMTIWRWAL